MFKLHPQKTGYTTINEHYATLHSKEYGQFNFKRNQTKSAPSCRLIQVRQKSEKMSLEQKWALSFCVIARLCASSTTKMKLSNGHSQILHNSKHFFHYNPVNFFISFFNDLSEHTMPVARATGIVCSDKSLKNEIKKFTGL